MSKLIGRYSMINAEQIVIRWTLIGAVAGYCWLQHDKRLAADELNEAVMTGNLEQVQTLLANGVDPNQLRPVSPNSVRAVGNALSIQDGDARVILVEHLTMTESQLMLERGIRERREYQYYPLHLAIYMGRSEIAEALLDEGAKTNRALPNGETPLHIAIARGGKLVELLLRHDADPNARNVDGKSPLHLAASGNQMATTRLLLNHGANLNAVDAKGETPLFDSVRAAISDTRGPRICQFLVAAGASIETLSTARQTPLLVAMVERRAHRTRPCLGTEQTFLWLIENSTHLDYQEPGGLGALHLADARLTAELLDAGASISRTTRPQMKTALHLAAELGEPKRLGILLDHKLDPAVRDWKGNTPMHLAARSGNEQTILALLNYSAPATEKNILGQTPLEIAIQEHHYSAAKLLASRLDPRRIVLPKAVLDENGTEAREIYWLAEFLATRDKRLDNIGGSLLTASHRGELATIEFVLAAEKSLSADLVATLHRLKPTALRRAVENGHWMIVKTLLDSGMELQSIKNGKPLLAIAVANENVSMVQLLLEHGADANLIVYKGRRQKRIVDVAIDIGDRKIVDLLMDGGAIPAQRPQK